MLGTGALSWRLAQQVGGQLLADPSTAVWRDHAGEWAAWTEPLKTNVLLARATHVLEVANWQRGADKKEGESKRHYPEPIYLPGQEPQTRSDSRRFGTARMSIDAMKRWLGWGRSRCRQRRVR